MPRQIVHNNVGCCVAAVYDSNCVAEAGAGEGPAAATGTEEAERGRPAGRAGTTTQSGVAVAIPGRTATGPNSADSLPKPYETLAENLADNLGRGQRVLRQN